MKKQYIEPAMKAVQIRTSKMLCGSDPGTKDVVSPKDEFSRRYNCSWDAEDEDLDDE